MGFEETPIPIVVFSVTIIVICVIGLLGNTVVLLLFLITKEYKKTTTNWYILQLTLADIIFLCTIPLRVSESIYGYWIHSLSACKANEGILFVTLAASVTFLGVMSIDRYIAVCRQFSLRWQKLRSSLSTTIITIVVWVLAGAIAIPIFQYNETIGIERCNCELIFPGSKSPCEHFSEEHEGFDFTCPTQRCITLEEDEEFHQALAEFQTRMLNGSDSDSFAIEILRTEHDHGEGFEVETEFDRNLSITFSRRERCHYTSEQAGAPLKAYIWYKFSALFIFPILAMSICYGKIIKRFRNLAARRRCGTRRKSSTSNRKTDCQKRRLIILCITLVVVFAVCWLLHHVVEILKLDRNLLISEHSCNIINKVSMVLIYLNSALNPYLYSFLGSGFKHKWRLLRSSRFAKQIIEATSGIAGIISAAQTTTFSGNERRSAAAHSEAKGKSPQSCCDTSKQNMSSVKQDIVEIPG